VCKGEIDVAVQMQDRETWLAERKKGIGGSDAAAICGLNPYKSPVEVWLEKTGQAPDEESESEAAYWGKRHEDMLAEEFAQRHPELTVYRIDQIAGDYWPFEIREGLWVSKSYPWMVATPDRVYRPKSGNMGIIEIKTASEYLRDGWGEDKAPQQYVIQVLHYLAVTGFDYGWLVVLIGGNKYREIEVERDEETIASLVEIERRFWHDHVLTGIPPAFDGSEASTELVKRLYPEGKPEAIELPPDAGKLVAEYEEAANYEKEWAARKEAAANQLRGMLGEYECGWVGDKKIIWSNVTANRLNTKALQKAHPEIYSEFCKASTYRRLTIK